jgi:8-oxo-dGTP pyrophosphatase MutT (NUDIX family)
LADGPVSGSFRPIAVIENPAKLRPMSRPAFFQLAYGLQRLVWRLLKVRTRGVKIMLFNSAGELALIRNSYGRTDLFVLPGGGVGPFEDPSAAARRELKEELGIEVTELSLRSTHSNVAEGKRDQIFLFEATTRVAATANSYEILEVRSSSPESLPDKSSPATRRRVNEFLGRRVPDGSW